MASMWAALHQDRGRRQWASAILRQLPPGLNKLTSLEADGGFVLQQQPSSSYRGVLLGAGGPQLLPQPAVQYLHLNGVPSTPDMQALCRLAGLRGIG